MKYITIQWTTEDIKHIIEAAGMRYSEQLAYSILEYVKDTHDANVGINWDVLSSAVDIFKTEEESVVYHSFNLPRIFLPASLAHVTYSDTGCRVSIFGVDGNLMYEGEEFLTTTEEDAEDETIREVASYLLKKYNYIK